MSERPLTPQEAADFLNVSRWQIYDYIRQGRLKATKLGDGPNKVGNKRHWRIWRKDLMMLLGGA